jgi:hypothetical protein
VVFSTLQFTPTLTLSKFQEVTFQVTWFGADASPSPASQQRVKTPIDFDFLQVCTPHPFSSGDGV